MGQRRGAVPAPREPHRQSGQHRPRRRRAGGRRLSPPSSRRAPPPRRSRSTPTTSAIPPRWSATRRRRARSARPSRASSSPSNAIPNCAARRASSTLQSQLEGTENRIAVALRDYNEAVRAYNTEIRTFPSLIAARFIYGAETLEPYRSRDRGRRNRADRRILIRALALGLLLAVARPRRGTGVPARRHGLCHRRGQHPRPGGGGGAFRRSRAVRGGDPTTSSSSPPSPTSRAMTSPTMATASAANGASDRPRRTTASSSSSPRTSARSA